MAEDKKDKKPVPTAEGLDRKTAEHVTTLLIGLLLLGVLASAILNILDNIQFGDGSFWDRLVDYFLTHIWPVWKLVALIISVLCIVGIIHSMRKLNAINLEESKIYGAVPEDSVLGTLEEEVGDIGSQPQRNERWEKVINYMNSDRKS